MKQLTRYVVSLLLATVIFYGCSKKENARVFDQTKEVAATEKIRTMQDILFAGELDYTNQITQYSSEGYMRSVTPLISANGNTEYFRYKVTETWAGAKAKSGWLVTHKALTKGDNLLQISFEPNAVSYHDESATNRKKVGKSSIGLKVKGNATSYSLKTPTVLFNPPACGGEPTDPVCIEWYWIFYDGDTGEIIEETYLYTTCEDICEGGGGGTGENGEYTCFLACQSDANGVLNAMEAEGGEETYVILPINELRKHKNPKWEILHNDFGNFKLWSQETGIVELADPDENKWQWVSLTHTGMSLTGSPPPAVAISYSQGTGTPSFVTGAQNILYAGMEVDFTVTTSFVCSACPVNNLVPPITKGYKVGKIFSAMPNGGIY